MSNHPHLNNAPITEALVDIKVKSSPGVDTKTLAEAHKFISDKYPILKHRIERKFIIEMGKDEVPKGTKDDKIVTVGFFTEAEDKVAQFGVDSFTFNWLKPYSTWEEMRIEVQALWELYSKVSSPEAITRIDLRYINRLELHGSQIDFSDYLTAAPYLPESLPQGLSSFFSRMVMYEPTHEFSAVLTQAFEGIAQPEIIPIILDIDVFKAQEFDIEKNDFWDILEHMRNFKNEVFFSCLTEKAIEVFK